MGEGLARAITIGSIVLTVASLTLAVVFARKKTRVRVGFDVARAVIGVGAILAMAMITNVTTPVVAVLVAVGVGVGLGFTQGSTLEISAGEKGLYAKRTPIALVGWGAGIILMQAAGIGSRIGAVQLGQTVAWFSACMGIGLIVGRTGPLNKSLARTGVAAAIIALALPATVLFAGAGTQATAVAAEGDRWVLVEVLVNPNGAPTEFVSGVTPNYFGDPRFDGKFDRYTVTATSISSHRRDVDYGVEFWNMKSNVTFDTPPAVAIPGEVVTLNASGSVSGTENAEWNPGEQFEFRADGVTLEGETYFAMGITPQRSPSSGSVSPQFTVPSPSSEDAEIRIYAFYWNCASCSVVWVYRAELAPPEATSTGTEPLPDVSDSSPSGGTPRDEATSPNPIDQSSNPSAGGGDFPPSSGDPISPEEAARQAIAGVIAAAAIGLITWGEATGEISRILAGLGGNGSGAPPKPPDPPSSPGPYIDPYDQTPLETDPATGMVWWPWDGTGGHWVAASEMPALLDAWNRELDAETASRVRDHQTRADSDWEDLKRRTRDDAQAERDRLDAERERRHKEQRVADRIRDIAEEADFDQMVAWLDENPSPTSEQLDALRAALISQIADKRAIDDLPDSAALLREALSRTMGADSEWDKDHVTWADVADFLGQRGLGTALRNPEMAARVGAAMATGGWSEAAVIPLIDVPRALEQANAARRAAGLPDLTADEARFIANNTIIKAITIDQVLERGIPIAGRILGGGGRAAREAAQEALDASMRRSGSAASDAMGTTAVRSLPGEEALGRSLDDGFGASGRGVDDGLGSGGDDAFGTLGRGDTGGGGGSLDDGLPKGDTVAPDEGIQLPPRREGTVPSPYGDQPVVERGAGVPGRQTPSGHFPPQPPRGSVDDLVRDAGAHQDTLGGPGVQPRASATPPRLDPETGPFDGRPPTPPPEVPSGIEDGGFEVGTPPSEGPPAFEPEFGPRTTINPDVEIPDIVDVDNLPTPPSWVGDIEGIKTVEDAMKPPTGSPHTAPTPMESPPSASTPRTPPDAPVPEARPSPSSAPETPPNQGDMEAVLRGDTPPGVDDVRIVDGDQFVGTAHADQGGWSPEALLREERFWHSDGTPILGPEGVDVKPSPRGWVLQFNPRTRTATPEFGSDLTSTQKARLKRPGGPIDQLERQINKMLDELENKP